MKRLLLLAGEESGVLYSRQIASEVKRRYPEAEIRGYADYGFETHDLAVMGFWAVLKKLFYFLRVKRTIERAIDEWAPEVVCTIDYPGLNLKLAGYAKSRGIRAVHVVCPQIWAWKQGRIPKIEAALDKLCCFFPFESAYFKSEFAEFVGHPLFDSFASLRCGLEDTRSDEPKKLLALLPGSRAGEIEKNLPTMLQVAERLIAELPDLKFVIPAANDRVYQTIESSISRGKVFASIKVTRGNAREVLCKADAAVVASGTATLEAALAGCPTVLVYRVGKILEFIARRLIKGIKHVGLANIIAEKSGSELPMPELLQDDFTCENILKFIRPWLVDAEKAYEARKKLFETMKLLKSDGNSIAKIVSSLV